LTAKLTAKLTANFRGRNAIRSRSVISQSAVQGLRN